MRAKLSVLRASHRVLKPGGRIAYYTIYIPPDLSVADYRRIMKFWPEAATRKRWPAEMLAAAGFTQVDETDVTEQYGVTARGWVEGRKRHYDELIAAIGETSLKDKIAEGEGILQALKDGLLRRSLLTARRSS